MTCLDFVLDEINPLGFLHLDVEGWEAYSLHGAGKSLCGVNDTCFVVCEVWDERDRKRRRRKRRHLSLRDANGFRPPCDDFLAAMAEHPNFKRIDDIIDQDRNLCFRFRGEEDSGGGGQMTMMRKLFCGKHSASSYSRNTKVR